MTPPPDLYRVLLRPLQDTGLPHMVTGGLAAILYGEPRLTNDVDVVVRLAPEQAGQLLKAFPPAEYYTPPIEVVQEEAGRPAHGHFNILHLASALRADVYCLSPADALGAWALQRVREVAVDDSVLSLAPMEYVILKKLEYYAAGGSDRHVRDIRAMLRLSGTLLDQPALEYWLGRLKLHDEWRRVYPSQDPR